MNLKKTIEEQDEIFKEIQEKYRTQDTGELIREYIVSRDHAIIAAVKRELVEKLGWHVHCFDCKDCAPAESSECSCSDLNEQLSRIRTLIENYDGLSDK